MKKKLFIHIGMNKTGTSSIQKFFSENRTELLDAGLLYPETGARGHAHYGISHALGFEAPGLAQQKPPQVQTAAEMSELLHAEVVEKDPEAILISSEDFVKSRSIDPVKNFLSSFDVKVMVGLRRHDEWWQSLYSQAVKTVEHPPWGRSFEEFVGFQKKRKQIYFSYSDLVDRWASAFGKENVIVFSVERRQSHPDIVPNFLSMLQVDGFIPTMSGYAERVNESPSLSALKLIDTFQRINIESNLRKRLIVHARSKKSKGNEYVASPELRRKLVDENLRDYAYIAKEYLGRSDERLFLAPLPDSQESWQETDELTDQEISMEVVQALPDGGSVEVMDAIRRERLRFELKEVMAQTNMATHINHIRDAAVALESKNPQLSYRLMSIALELRPDGSFLKQKIREYERILMERGEKK